MRLRKPCEHGRYEAHERPLGVKGLPNCPGGEFLADDALVIEGVTIGHEKLERALAELYYEPNPDGQGRNTTPVRYPLDVIATAAKLILDALTVRQGESAE